MPYIPFLADQQYSCNFFNVFYIDLNGEKAAKAKARR